MTQNKIASIRVFQVRIIRIAGTWPEGFFPRKFVCQSDAENLKDFVINIGGAAVIEKVPL